MTPVEPDPNDVETEDAADDDNDGAAFPPPPLPPDFIEGGPE